MKKKIKTLIYPLVLAVIAAGFIGGFSGLDNVFDGDEILTGQFTDAGENRGEMSADSSEVYVEKIYWEFGNRTVEGRIAKHNFSEGTHNVTVTTVKSNGENETHKAQLKIE